MMGITSSIVVRGGRCLAASVAVLFVNVLSRHSHARMLVNAVMEIFLSVCLTLMWHLYAFYALVTIMPRTIINMWKYPSNVTQ